MYTGEVAGEAAGEVVSADGGVSGDWSVGVLVASLCRSSIYQLYIHIISNVEYLKLSVQCIQTTTPNAIVAA